MTGIISALAGSAIKDTVEAVGDEINKKAELQAQSDANQVEIDKTEAGNTNLFVAGWRPFCGWTCSIAFAYHGILQPFILFIFALFGKKIDLPEFDESTLNSVLMGLLGLGTLRTVEKMPWKK